jgi:hypothetical protein
VIVAGAWLMVDRTQPRAGIGKQLSSASRSHVR